MLPDVERRLRAAGVDHRWVIVGDGSYRRDLERRLDNAVFLGTVPHAGVARPLASADMFVFPSCTDMAGNVVLEAQACGLPVLVSDRGGPRENMLPDESGFVCRGGQVEDFTDAIVGLASNPALRRAMAAAARRYALSRRWGGRSLRSTTPTATWRRDGRRASRQRPDRAAAAAGGM